MKHKRPISRDIALPLAIDVANALRKHEVAVIICGSLRRKCKMVGDIDIVVAGLPLPEIIDILQRNFPIRPLTKKAKHSYFFMYEEVYWNIFWAERRLVQPMVLFATGDANFNILCRKKAKGMGFKLNQYGLFDQKEVLTRWTEASILSFLGMSKYILPEDRSIS